MSMKIDTNFSELVRLMVCYVNEIETVNDSLRERIMREEEAFLDEVEEEFTRILSRLKQLNELYEDSRGD